MKAIALIMTVLLLSGCLMGEGKNSDDHPPPGLIDPMSQENRSQASPIIALEAQLTNCTKYLTFIRTPTGTIDADVPEAWQYNTIDSLHIFDTFTCTRIGWQGNETEPTTIMLESTSIGGVADKCLPSGQGIVRFVHAIYGSNRSIVNALSTALGAPAFLSNIQVSHHTDPLALTGRIELQPEASRTSAIETLWPSQEKTAHGAHSIQYMHTNETHTARLALDSLSTWIPINEYHGTGQFHEPVVASRSPAPSLPLTLSFYFDFNASGVVYTWNEPLCGA